MTNEKCPGDRTDFRVIEFEWGGKTHALCYTQYLKSQLTGFNPDSEKCPGCRYNRINVAEEVENEFLERARKFVQRGIN